ncbi:MAG: biotin synthase BioB [Candidatus Aenigmatarchaeota archaeon]
MRDYIFFLENKVLSGEKISFNEALNLTECDSDTLPFLLASANRIRKFHKGDLIKLCSIVNAKSGNCPEDCAFCSQSARNKANIPVYPFIGAERILEHSRAAYKSGAKEFSIVISGKSIRKGKDLDELCKAIELIKGELPLKRCASVGIIDREVAKRLKDAGLQHYHHNLETSRSFYPNICSTRPYDVNIESVKIAKSMGFKVCCGGIFGMGEAWKDRIELAMELRQLDVDSIPLNFLIPIKGTRLEHMKPIRPLEALKIIAIYRFIHPERDIFVCGGREHCLRDLQSWIFLAGANGTMLGNYLTTLGRPPEEDLQLLDDLELKIWEG